MEEILPISRCDHGRRGRTRGDSVGNAGDYGIDLLVFANNEVLSTTIQNTDGIGELKLTCDIKNWPDFQFPAAEPVSKEQASVDRITISPYKLTTEIIR